MEKQNLVNGKSASEIAFETANLSRTEIDARNKAHKLEAQAQERALKFSATDPNATPIPNPLVTTKERKKPRKGEKGGMKTQSHSNRTG